MGTWRAPTGSMLLLPSLLSLGLAPPPPVLLLLLLPLLGSGAPLGEPFPWPFSELLAGAASLAHHPLFLVSTQGRCNALLTQHPNVTDALVCVFKAGLAAGGG